MRGLLGLVLWGAAAWCAAGPAVPLRILSTNDIHAYLQPGHARTIDELRPWGAQSREGDFAAKARLTGKAGGMAHVATVIQRLRSEKPGNTLLVDAGDTWHGSGISLFDRGETMVKIMNAIGYDVMTPGNWEFIFPRDRFLKLVEMAQFPVVAFNLTDREWDEPVLEPYHVQQVGPLKVAVIGMTYPWTAITSASLGAAKWYQFGIREEAASALIREIRQDHDPDLIVMVSHGGFGLDQKFARRVDGIDVLVSGHTHDEVFEPVVWNDTIIFQAGAHGKYVASLDLTVTDKRVTDFHYRLVKVDQRHVPPDPQVAELVSAAYAPYRKQLATVIGEAGTTLYRRAYWQSPLGNFLTDAMRAMTGTDIAFFPAWRYGATILPGKIRVEDIYNILPSRETIHTFMMPGRQLRRLLENILGSVADHDPYTRVGGDMIRFSGLTLRYDLRRQAGDRIVSLTVGDKPLEPDRNYRIASVHTRFQDNPLFGATQVKDTGTVFVEALVEYIRRHSPIAPTLDDRIGPADPPAPASPAS